VNANQYLTDADFAKYFLQVHTVRPGEDVLDVEPRVERWLSRSGMGHRSPFKIAVQVSKLAKAEPAPAPLPTPDEILWR
jgi:hypothetical protein